MLDVFYSLREPLREFRLVLVAMFTIGGYFAIVAAVPLLILSVWALLTIIMKR